MELTKEKTKENLSILVQKFEKVNLDCVPISPFFSNSNLRKEIDELVYKLYGINEEERRIIEQETARSSK